MTASKSFVYELVNIFVARFVNVSNQPPFHCFIIPTILCRFQISTLATKLGVRNIAFLGSGLLLINYIGAILAAVYLPQVRFDS